MLSLTVWKYKKAQKPPPVLPPEHNPVPRRQLAKVLALVKTFALAKAGR
jgi:hypothetical protein